MSADGLKQEYIAIGKDKFYRDLLVCAFKKLILIEQGAFRGLTPELEYLDQYGQFIILYRRTGDGELLEIAKMLRKAANKVYRIMLKKNMTKRDDRFFNIVQ